MADEEDTVLQAQAIGRAISESNSRTIKKIVESVPSLEELADRMKVPTDFYVSPNDKADTESQTQADIEEQDMTELEKDCAKLMPKTEERRREWGRIFSIIEQQREEYFADEDSIPDNPEPTYDDIRTRLRDNMIDPPQERTLRDVKKAGRLGCLDNYEP